MVDTHQGYLIKKGIWLRFSLKWEKEALIYADAIIGVSPSNV